MVEITHKPFPEITAQTQPFWQAAKQGELLVQSCEQCGTKEFFPRPWCVECGGRKLRWVKASGKGTVYAHSTASVVMMNYPGWKDDLPMTLAIVELDEGTRLYARIVNAEPDEVSIDMTVEVDFESIGDDIMVPVFKPVRS